MLPLLKMCLFLILQMEIMQSQVSTRLQFLHQNRFLHPFLKETLFRPMHCSNPLLVAGAIHHLLYHSNKVQADQLDHLTGNIEQRRWLPTTLSIARRGYRRITSMDPSHYLLDTNKKLLSKDKYIFFMYQQV